MVSREWNRKGTKLVKLTYLMQPRDNADSASMMCCDDDFGQRFCFDKSSCGSENRALYSNALADPRRDSLYALPWSDYVRRGRLQLFLSR